MEHEEEKKLIKKERKKGFLFTLLCSLITFVLGVSLASSFGLSDSTYDKDLENLIYYYNILKNEWYFGDDELTEEALQAAINAIYRTYKDIDPYTYFTQAPVIIENGGTNTSIDETPVTYGIGISLKISVDSDKNLTSEGLIVFDVYSKGGSANILKTGDQILGCYVDNDLVLFEGKQYSEIEEYIKTTENNSPLTLYVKRDDSYLNLEVIRKSYSTNYIFEQKIDEDICSTCVGVKISQFSNSSSIEFKNVLDEIVEKEEKEGNSSNNLDLIIDLRNNPGGLVTSFVNIADYFLPSGLDLIYYEYKDGHVSSGGATSTGVRYSFNSITILLNESSASASEAFTLALKDYSSYLNNKVQVVGTKSFGKGIAQNEIPLPDGSSVRYTFARTLSPSLKSIHGIGIEPDIEIPLDDYNSALSYVNAWVNQFNTASEKAAVLGGLSDGK